MQNIYCSTNITYLPDYTVGGYGINISNKIYSDAFILNEFGNSHERLALVVLIKILRNSDNNFNLFSNDLIIINMFNSKLEIINHDNIFLYDKLKDLIKNKIIKWSYTNNNYTEKTQKICNEKVVELIKLENETENEEYVEMMSSGLTPF